MLPKFLEPYFSHGLSPSLKKDPLLAFRTIPLEILFSILNSMDESDPRMIYIKGLIDKVGTHT